MPKLFKTEIASAADLKVFVTDVRSEADLIVYETMDEWAAAESQVWCYTDVQSAADKVIYFADSPFDADLIVYRTDVQPDADWANSAKSGLL
jgi:hypothetical protein